MSKNKDELTPTQILAKIYPQKCKQANFPLYKQFADILKAKADEEEEIEQVLPILKKFQKRNSKTDSPVGREPPKCHQDHD